MNHANGGEVRLRGAILADFIQDFDSAHILTRKRESVSSALPKSPSGILLGKLHGVLICPRSLNQACESSGLPQKLLARGWGEIDYGDTAAAVDLVSCLSRAKRTQALQWCNPRRDSPMWAGGDCLADRIQ